MMSSFWPNDTRKLKSVKTSTIPWYPTKQSDVIAIDFGTSTLALAYKVGGRVNDLRIQEDCADAYVPTVLLIKENKHGGGIEIGERALVQYRRMEGIDPEECLYFQKVKLELQNDQRVGLETTILGTDGRKYFLVQVIGLILQKIKQKLSTFFKKRGDKYLVEDFHWVLTVPALWGEKARDMMKEAAYLAGLCSNQSRWDELLALPLKPASLHHQFKSIKQFEPNPERLSLVYEPDAAAAWCKQITEKEVKTCTDTKPPVTTDNFFLTIDVGGGTIDVTAHQVLQYGRMKRVNIPHGEVYGGTIVNEAFRTFLETEVVQDFQFKQYLEESSDKSENAENAAELVGLFYDSFEQTKKVFAESDDTENFFVVQLPVSFSSTYHSLLQRFKSKDIKKGDQIAYKQRTQQLQLNRQKMASFFAPNIAKLEECVIQARDAVIEKHGNKFEIFYLVGGFGGCKYLADHVRRKFGSPSLKVIVPMSHDLAVVRGACVYYDYQVLINSDATYGFGVSKCFNPRNPIHTRGTSRTRKDGSKRATNLFQPVIQIGQEIVCDEVFIHDSLTPFDADTECVKMNFYSTLYEYVNYTDGEDKKKLHTLGSLQIDVSEGMHLPHSERVFEVLMDFNGIEIKIYARFLPNGKRVNASIDFLSTLHKFDSI